MDFVIGLQHESDYIEACARNERWAQEVIYKEFYPSMMAICLRYSNNKFKQGTSLGAWIKRIMVNTAIDFYRKNVRRRTEDLDTVYDMSSSAPDAISQMSAQDILNCLQKLTPSYRTVFNLYVIEGYSHKEISEKLDISESTSRSNLVKARGKLKTLLEAKSVINGRE